MSRIGNMPVAVPAAVEIDIADDNTVTVKGPKGALTQRLSPRMRLQKDNGTIVIERPDHGQLFLPKTCALMAGLPNPFVAATAAASVFVSGLGAAAALRLASAAAAFAATSVFDTYVPPNSFATRLRAST